MKLIGDIIIEPFNTYAKFILTEIEVKEEQKLMEQIRLAQMEVLFDGNIRALHDLKYKRDIQLDDGRTLVGSWCRNLEQINDIYIAEYCFDKILNKEEK